MQSDQLRVMFVFGRGCLMVLGQVVMVSILILWGLQAFAAPYGETHDWAAVLEHLILTLTFVAFFPGQSFWNFQVSDGRGGVISIIGRATHADQSYATRK